MVIKSFETSGSRRSTTRRHIAEQLHLITTTLKEPETSQLRPCRSQITKETFMSLNIFRCSYGYTLRCKSFVWRVWTADRDFSTITLLSLTDQFRVSSRCHLPYARRHESKFQSFSAPLLILLFTNMMTITIIMIIIIIILIRYSQLILPSSIPSKILRNFLFPIYVK